MNGQEKYMQLMAQSVRELLDGINAGDFADIRNIPPKYKYRHLCALFRMAYSLDNGIALYEKLYDLVMASGKMALQKKVKKGEKIKVAFLAISAAEWPAEGVYQLLEKDLRLECYIVICPLLDRSKEAMEQTYLKTCTFLEESGHKIKKVYDEKEERYREWDEIGGIPDILIHLTPWYQALPEQYWIESLPFSCLNCYIPYSFFVVTSTDGNYGRSFVYNKEFMNMIWKNYIDSEYNMKAYQKLELLRGKNVIYTGYAKMDYFYNKKLFDEKKLKEIWKISSDEDIKAVKKLIIAPHHSICSSAGIELSTFSKNAYFLLYLAEKYRNKISFILKPHPNLRARAVEAGLFKNYNEYDAYLKKWDSLPNAKVVQEADYLEIFETSDGMIMDCGSFLAEYMYVNKPLLFLRKESQAFTDLGEKILNCCYQVDGEDYLGIEQFVLHVILDGNDELEFKRKQIYEEELDYVAKNHCLASESIYQDVVGLLD